MKLSSHNARMDASGLHNDRNFDLTLAPHILMDRLEDNKYFSYNGDLSVPFIESEEEYYREHFSPYLDNRKKRSEEARQYARIKSISDYHTDKATRPEDKIIQIGDKDDHISGEQLWEICLEYQKKFDMLYGNHCKILNMALHMDEETPHVHIRRVWSYTNSNGFEQVGQTKALEEMGVLPPHPSKSRTRYNNTKITFTNKDRSILEEICLKRGIELENDHDRRRSMPLKKYIEADNKARELNERAMELEQQIADRKIERDLVIKSVTSIGDVIENFLGSDLFDDQYVHDLETLRKKDVLERTSRLIEMFNSVAENALESQSFGEFIKSVNRFTDIASEEKAMRLEQTVYSLRSFIKDHDLTEEYDAYIRKDYEKDPRFKEYEPIKESY